MDDFKNIFTQAPELVVNAESDEEKTMKVGPEGTEGVDLTWEKLYNNGKEKLEAQEYDATECDCLAVLGKKMMMQACRYNKAGELYLKAYNVCHINDDGKVWRVESFADPDILDHIIPTEPAK